MVATCWLLAHSIVLYVNIYLICLFRIYALIQNKRRQVQEAECTNPFDEERIRGAIRGFEKDVDITVRVLMLAGAYTPTLRKAYDSGEDIRGAGILNLKFKVSHATKELVLGGCEAKNKTGGMVYDIDILDCVSILFFHPQVVYSSSSYDNLW